jgi:hypothetical protein
LTFSKINVFANEWKACLNEVNEACALSWVKRNLNLFAPITPEEIERAQSTNHRLMKTKNSKRKVALIAWF